ncbi:AMP-binding protein [Streptomyces sp. NBC_01550]|uniref:class I adenylate-forming enzyme family protein n=1 Tax=Streptomyces TaxID=1883 RepID=UPI003393A088
MKLVELLVGKHVSAGAGDRVSHVDPDVGEVTYAQLHEAVAGYAGALRERGVPAGTRALVVADDSVATTAAILGLWWHGCVPVPVSPALSDPELRFMAADSEAGFAHFDLPNAARRELGADIDRLPHTTGDEVRTIFRSDTGSHAYAPEAAAEEADWAAGQPALIQYTSGSTGSPKGVLHAATGIEAVAASVGSLLGLGPDDVVLSTAKVSFGYGFGNSVILPLAAGARTVVLRGGVDAHAVHSALHRHRPTVLFSVPRMYVALLALAAGHGTEATASLRLAATAGEHCPAALAERVRETFGVPLVNGLGATEALHFVVATPPAAITAGATGLPVPGATATVRGEDGGPVPEGTEGRLHVAGPSVALGYLNRTEATRRTFADGGVYTGDIVRRDDAGELWYLCRADDLLNMGGYKVAPGEIEAVVREADEVAECAVVAVSDENGLDQAVAYAVPVPGADPSVVRKAILALLRTRLAAFKRPARVEVIDVLPTTSTGKLARNRLRESAGREAVVER